MCDDGECGQCVIYADALSIAETNLGKIYDMIGREKNELDEFMTYVADCLTLISRVL